MSAVLKSHSISLNNDRIFEHELMDSSSRCVDKKKDFSQLLTAIRNSSRTLQTARAKQGVYSVIQMCSAGFTYTGDGDTARCGICGLQVSNWTLDMKPFNVHAERNPTCSFVQSVKASLSSSSMISYTSSSILPTNARNTVTSNEPENPSKRQKIEPNDSISSSNTLLETNLIQQVRRRTFSHWPHRTIPSVAQMIEAGFFNCNVGDRVICIYCNLICQQWTPHTDDPCQVHKTLSPTCIYVTAKLIRPAASSIIIVNEASTNGTSNNQPSTLSSNLDPLRSNEIVFTAACNPAYTEIPKRHASFMTWSAENLPSVDDLVRAGFFYTGTKTIVTCFYCNGSLQNWGPNDNPMIEHARWFPHCAYAKQLCGDDLYRKIQESKRAQQERARMNEMREKTSIGQITTANIPTNSRQLPRLDESTLSSLVAARLDLPISQRLLDQQFKLSIIKRCWEDQLRLKQDDFVSDCDLFIACLILQKQIEHIDGKKENIVIPSIQMKHIREKAEKDRKVMDFTEEINKTIKREQTFIDWPHLFPSRINMLTAGWHLDRTESNDHTKCQYCDVSYYNWQPEDSPSLIHRDLSPFCPFVLSTHPMHTDAVSIKSLGEILTPEIVANKLNQPVADVIQPSNSPYSRPPDREKTFSKFPHGRPDNVNTLIGAGFYYTGVGTMLRCYNCSGTVRDFHQYSSDEINIRHRNQFPHCRFAQLLPEKSKTMSTSNNNLCKWCVVEPKQLVVYPCEHQAVCKLCARLTNTCPICSSEAATFMKIYA